MLPYAEKLGFHKFQTSAGGCVGWKKGKVHIWQVDSIVLNVFMQVLTVPSAPIITGRNKNL